MGDEQLHPFEAAERQRSRILNILRMALLVMLVTVALLTVMQDGDSIGTITAIVPWWVPLSIALALFGVVMLIERLTPNKKIATISAGFLGLFIGLLATVSLSVVFRLILRAWMDEAAYRNFEPFLLVIEVLTGIALCYLAISTVIQTQDDFRLVIPYVEFAKQLRGPKPLLLDSSVLIDARIVEVAATGILQVPIVVPRFVVSELQLLADSSDKMKRSRGRRGLDVITRLQRMGRLDVTIDDTRVAGKAVDTMLIELARHISGTVVTSDTGLARVAQIQDVTVLNINELANALKPALIPGERLHLHLVKRGEQPGQGVGYLEDGTMVVVDGGEHKLDKTIEAEVTSTIQTSAGRMIFAKLLDDNVEASAPQETPDDAFAAANEVIEVPEAEEPEPEPTSQPRPVATQRETNGPFGPDRKPKPNRARNPRR